MAPRVQIRTQTTADSTDEHIDISSSKSDINSDGDDACLPHGSGATKDTQKVWKTDIYFKC